MTSLTFAALLFIAIHLGILRHLRDEVGARAWIPWVAIALDVAVLVPFVLLKAQSDPFTLVVTAVVALVIVVAQWSTVRHRSDEDARQGEHEQR